MPEKQNDASLSTRELQQRNEFLEQRVRMIAQAADDYLRHIGNQDRIIITLLAVLETVKRIAPESVNGIDEPLATLIQGQRYSPEEQEKFVKLLTPSFPAIKEWIAKQEESEGVRSPKS